MNRETPVHLAAYRGWTIYTARDCYHAMKRGVRLSGQSPGLLCRMIDLRLNEDASGPSRKVKK